MSASLHSVSRQTGVKTLPSLVVSNKRAFQSNANCPLVDSSCFIVKKFEDVEGGGLFSEVPVEQVEHGVVCESLGSQMRPKTK